VVVEIYHPPRFGTVASTCDLILVCSSFPL
jgi:hypothetical protein